MADVGITITPTKRSVTARLDNMMCEGFCSSFIRFIARITDPFKIMVGNEAMTDARPIIK